MVLELWSTHTQHTTQAFIIIECCFKKKCLCLTSLICWPHIPDMSGFCCLVYPHVICHYTKPFYFKRRFPASSFPRAAPPSSASDWSYPWGFVNIKERLMEHSVNLVSSVIFRNTKSSWRNGGFSRAHRCDSTFQSLNNFEDGSNGQPLH